MSLELLPIVVMAGAFLITLIVMNILANQSAKRHKQLLISMHEKMVLNHTPILTVEWMFTFLDISPSSAFVYHSFNDEYKILNCIVIVSLTPKADERSIIHAMNHEALHCAIKMCMMNGSIGEENVINRMLELSK